MLSIDGSKPLSSTSVVSALALFHHWLSHRPVLWLYHVFCKTSKAVWAYDRYSALVLLVERDFKGLDACRFVACEADDDREDGRDVRERVSVAAVPMYAQLASSSTLTICFMMGGQSKAPRQVVLYRREILLEEKKCWKRRSVETQAGEVTTYKK